MNRSIRFAQCILLGFVIGCSKEAAPTPSATAAPTVAPATAATASAAPAVVPASAPTAVQSAKPTPLATSEGSLDGVRVEVTELKRTSGTTLSLRFAIVNDSDKAVGHGDVGGVGLGGLMDAPYTIGGVHLIDAVGKKKYFVAKDSAGACVCSSFDFVKPKTRANHWARFSAPPDDVERISVVIPPFAPMDDVVIAR